MYSQFILRAVAGLTGWIIASRKGRNPFFWALLCCIFPFVVLVVLILPFNPATGKTRQCPYCLRVINREDAVCPHCNKELPIDMVRCSECGSFVPDKDYCMQCNKTLKK